MTFAAVPKIVEADICIYGGTSGGVAAAVQASRLGKRVVIAEPGEHLGGMTAGGLSAVDIGDPRSIGGIARQYFTRLVGSYGRTLAWDQEFKGHGGPATGGAFAIEPHTAEQLFDTLAREAKVPVHFAARLASVKKDGPRIVEFTTDDGTIFRAKMFIDATYEGDLMALAGVSYTLEREGNARYGEKYNGIYYADIYKPRRNHAAPGSNGRVPGGQGVWDRDLPLDPYVVPGDPKSGLLPLVQAGDPGKPGEPAPGVQAYCFRLCLTTADDRLPITAPSNYDPKRYELVARFIAGCQEIGNDMDLRWFSKYDPLPNQKWDFNTATFGGNLPGASWEWPTASYARRQEIARDHENYHRGLLHFLATDSRVPEKVRGKMQSFGLPRDEFQKTGGWPHQIYVREARRMVSDLVMTEHHTFGRKQAPQAISLGSYGTDVHEIRRIVKDGVVIREGKIATGRDNAPPYPIGYGAIVPKASECDNLLVTFALSASHTAFASIRMEPVFMATSQSAATAASQAIDERQPVQNVNYEKLRERLLADGQVLDWKSATRKKTTAAAPVKILFDTDMMTDCDDAGAMAVLHALADNGECEILATVTSVSDPKAAQVVDVINTYYGRPDLPIGMVKHGGAKVSSKFVPKVAAEFPHDLQADAVPSATRVYRDVLAKQPDGSVVVCTVGYLTNLHNLLKLKADGPHPSGVDLIRSKVKKWVCMGGNFIGSPARDDLKLGNVNFQRDAESALYVIRNWPGEVVFCGREVCSVPSGVEAGACLAKTPASNPVRQAYYHYFGANKSRHVADLVTVLYAVRGLRDYWDLHAEGSMNLHDDITFDWLAGPSKGQAYLLKKQRDGTANDRYIESVLDELLVQPPSNVVQVAAHFGPADPEKPATAARIDWQAQAKLDAAQDRTSIAYDGISPNKLVCDTTLRELPDGSWALFMLAGGETEPSPHNYTGLTRSHDQGKTWSKLERFDVGFPREGKTIGQGPTELMILGDHCTLFFSTHSKTWDTDWQSWFLTSDDSFRTWSKPQPMPGRLARFTFIRNHIKTRDGRILVPFQHYLGPPPFDPAIDDPKKPRRGVINPRNGVLMSSDNGKTWTEHGDIRLTKDDARYHGWAENNLFETTDGRIQMIIRADRLGGVLYYAESKDGGRTWPEFAVKSDIPNPGSKATLYALGGDAVAILHNPNPAHRSPMSLWISFDAMKSWPYQRVLVKESCDGPKGRMNYPDGFVSKDKQYLHFAFDDNRHRAVYVGAKLPPLPSEK